MLMVEPMQSTIDDICVVVPAHQAEQTLQACLDALFAAGFSGGDIVLVDDGSTDATYRIANANGTRVVRNPKALRPARARNVGVAESDREIILFVDADVVVHDDILPRIRRHFDDPSVTAVIGSYDDLPPPKPVVSRYRNLLHHYTHQIAGPTVGTFWTGLGAVRRDAFEQVGGLKSEWENIEDVEFGLRLVEAGGTIALDPDMQGTHLKIWTLGSMFRTDLWGRAVPWTRLIVANRTAAGSLNTTFQHQVSAAAVAGGVLFLPFAPFAAAAFWGFVLCCVAFLGANAGFLRALARIGGPWLAVRAVPYHVVHYVAALAGYLYVRAGPLLGRRQDASTLPE